jgi:hypothetical protein
MRLPTEELNFFSHIFLGIFVGKHPDHSGGAGTLEWQLQLLILNLVGVTGWPLRANRRRDRTDTFQGL